MIPGELGDTALKHLQQMRTEYLGCPAKYWALTIAIDAVIGVSPEGLREDAVRLCKYRGAHTCDATVVRHCEDYGELCGKKCEPGSYLCPQHKCEGQ